MECFLREKIGSEFYMKTGKVDEVIAIAEICLLYEQTCNFDAGMKSALNFPGTWKRGSEK